MLRCARNDDDQIGNCAWVVAGGFGALVTFDAPPALPPPGTRARAATRSGGLRRATGTETRGGPPDDGDKTEGRLEVSDALLRSLRRPKS